MAAKKNRPDTENVEPAEKQVAGGTAENDSHDTTEQPGLIDEVDEQAAEDERDAAALTASKHAERVVRAKELEERYEGLLDLASKHREQTRMSYEFAADHLDRALFVWGLGWFTWDGTRWAEDTGQAQEGVKATIRRLAPDAIDDKDLYADLRSAQKASGVAGVLKLASSIDGLRAKADELDAHPYLLNCANGVLDLKTLELKEHDPALRLTKMTGASYDPKASRERWTKFLEEVLPDEEVRGYFQRFVGLSLIGKVLEHTLTIATGTGRNGKGVAYGAIMTALGDYAGAGAPGLFEVAKANPNAPSPAFFELRGKRLVVLSEMEDGARVAAALMKRLTGGDRIKARDLNKGLVEFEPSHSALMVTNHLPKLPANDPAVWKRMAVIPFDVVVPEEDQDEHLPEKLENEIDGILAWAVEGLRDYLANGLCPPDAVVARTQQYAESQDDARRFVEAVCVEVLVGGTLHSELHAAFTEWALSEGIDRAHVLGRTQFGEALDHLGFPASRSKKGMVRKGLMIQGKDAEPSLEEIVEAMQEAENAKRAAEEQAAAEAEVKRIQQELATIEAAVQAEREEDRWAHSEEAHDLIAAQAGEDR